ncbi:hypothetical protein [Amycolatopsis sp. WAC 01416]|uniref:hypothetical protein n=1 Tax=Amycolatopsis sp. WAC 01416 TaxID=2203196 RepID=UPI000F76E5DE|nr:hypothetical protein [Amycolatopsis sp. WAC 01416]
MIQAREVVEALSVHGVVDWSRIAVGRSILSGLVLPPMIVWRYLESSESSRRAISAGVDNFSGSLTWAFNFERRNWTLMPVKVSDAFAKADPTYVNVLSDLAKSDQDTWVTANEDLASLLSLIKESKS